MADLPTVTWTQGFIDETPLWAHNDPEHLTHESLYECVYEAIADGVFDAAELADPKTVLVVYGYKPDMPTRGECEFLDNLIEQVEDDRHGPDDDDGCFTKNDLEVLKRAEQVFIDLLLAYCHPWAHSPAVKITVPIAKEPSA
jgi:hypothetical protein